MTITRLIPNSTVRPLLGMIIHQQRPHERRIGPRNSKLSVLPVKQGQTVSVNETVGEQEVSVVKLGFPGDISEERGCVHRRHVVAAVCQRPCPGFGHVEEKVAGAKVDHGR